MVDAGNLNPLVIAGRKAASYGLARGTPALDFSSQLVNVNIGYQHPRVLAAMQQETPWSPSRPPPPTCFAAKRRSASSIWRRRVSVRCSFSNAGADATRERDSHGAVSIPGATRCRRPIVPIMATPAARSPLPATGAGCRMSSPRGHVHFSTPTFTAASSTPRLRKRSASARWRICGGSLNARGRRPSRRSCWRVHPRTAGDPCRRRYMQGACAPWPTRVWHRADPLDEVMAGFFLAAPAAGSRSSRMAWCRIW